VVQYITMVYGPFHNVHGDIPHPESLAASELRSDSDEENEEQNMEKTCPRIVGIRFELAT